MKIQGVTLLLAACYLLKEELDLKWSFLFVRGRFPENAQEKAVTPPIRLCGYNANDADLFRLACVNKQEAKEEEKWQR